MEEGADSREQPAYRCVLFVIRAITHIEMPDTIVNRQPFALREKPEVIRCHRRVTLARRGFERLTRQDGDVTPAIAN